MSNVIQIGGNPLIVSLSDIDVAKLRLLIDEHAGHRNPEGSDWFCWFLRDNIEISDTVKIWLGSGMSFHTWRDLDYTLRQVSKLMAPGSHIEHTFDVSDEYDGFTSHGPLRVLIGHRVYNVGMSGPDTIVPVNDPMV